MRNPPERTPRSEAFRSAIAAFIDERREAKQKAKEMDADGASKYDYGAWLADAAARAHHIQIATHIAKATHPKSQGSNFLLDAGRSAQYGELGSHSLGHEFVQDAAVDDAKHLDVYSLLSNVVVEGHPLLHWIKAGDSDLTAVLSEDPSLAQDCLEKFAVVSKGRGLNKSDPRNKQVFWLVGNDATQASHFHLLQPLFASSLAQAIYEDIQSARFGESNSELRKARKEKLPATGIYREYIGITALMIGGSNTQNVSRLNNKRRGVNYLLASLPPQWKSTEGPRLIGRSSALDVFGHTPQARKLIKELATFLKTNPPPNMATRLRREGIEQALGMQLMAFAEQVQKTQPLGWTRHADCDLPECEKLWLDSGRADPELRGQQHLAQDRDFEQAYHWGDWPDQVASRFANWVNAKLRDAGIESLGDTEYRHWAKQTLVEVAWPVPLQRRAAQVPA